jgi:hypothetical protein
METQQNNQASAVTAGNDTTGGSAGSTSAGSPVVAPKGFRSELQQMLQGWQGIIPSSSALASSVGSLTQASVVQQLQTFLAAYSALDSADTAAKQTRAQVKAQLSQARQYQAVLKTALRNNFGEDSVQLAQFGLKPKKARKPLSTEKAAVKVAKLRATRVLRGTKGPVARAAVKSGPMQFVGPVAVPVTPGASTAAGPAAADPSASAVSSPVVGK